MTSADMHARHPWSRRSGTVAACAAATALCATIVLPTVVANLVGRESGIAVADLPTVVATEFTRWQLADTAAPTDLLEAAARTWGAFHTVKACTAVALLIALAAVARHLWQAWTTDLEHRPAAVIAAAGMLVAASVGVAGVVAVANIQGAIAPLSSLLSVVPTTAPAAASAAASEIHTGALGPATATLVGDFRLYHAAFALAGLGALSALIAVLVRIIGLRRRTPGEPSRVLLSVNLMTAAAGLSIVGTAVLIAANVATAISPAEPLAAFLAGGA